MDSDLEPKLISLISELVSSSLEHYWQKMFRLTIQIISLVSSMDLDTQPTKSELISLIKQTISLFNSMDLDSQPEPLSELISLISQTLSRLNPMYTVVKLATLFSDTLSLDPEPELMSLIHQICSMAISMDMKLEKFISLCPQVIVYSDKGELKISKPRKIYSKWEFVSRGCNGKNYEGYEKAPFDVKHPLHRKHSLRLVFLEESRTTMTCYFCHEDLEGILYCCSACNFAIDLACVDKPQVLSIEQPKWHEHTLALFPRKASLPCNLCALSHSSCPFYICPPCDFVVHQSCIKLPHVIRISAKLYRIR